MPSKARIRVWCEDREHESFIRSLFESLGVGRKSLHIIPAPRGTGSASNWVIKRYPELLREARASKHQADLGFLVVVDRDNYGPARRRQQLREESGGQGDTNERIAVLVPTWSIETWVLWLTGAEVNEATSVKDRLDSMEFRGRLGQAVRAWASPSTNEATAVPSLNAARAELKKLPL